MTRCPCDRAGLPVLPDGTLAAQCFLCDLREVNAEAIDALSAHPTDCPCIPCARAFGREAPTRAWTVTVADVTTAPTVRPPADQRCERCDRVLIATPCPCVTPVERYLRAADERDAAWRALSRAERIEAIRRRAA